jgi:hypothetical protein
VARPRSRAVAAVTERIGRARGRLLVVVVIALVGAGASIAGPRSGAAAPRAARTSASRATAPVPATSGGSTLKLSAELAGYADSDAVFVASPTISASVGDEVAGWSVSGRYLVDAVSAASVDIVSSASGKWTELRHVGSGVATMKAGSVGLSVSGGFSREPDYLSLGGGGTVSFEALDKNVTPFLGLSYSHDDVGRTGFPKATWSALRRIGGQTGATIVIDRSTIFGFTVDAIFERGDLSKPYRYVPLFAPGVGATVPAGASVAQVNATRSDLRPNDALPGARDRFALTGRLAHRWEESTFRIDERIYGDSWGALASTTDARHTVDVTRSLMVWPHLRLHGQRGVDFWQRTYEVSVAPDGGPGVPRFRTGDRELGPLVTVTLGLGLRWRVSADGTSPWVLFFQADGIYTRYFDALYLIDRRALFTATGIEMEF